MSIERFFNKTIVIKRLSTVSGSKINFVSTGTVEGHIQRIDERTSQDAYGSYGATHRAWVGMEDNIKDGDQVIDPSGNVYSVVSVIDEGEDIAMNEHKEIILRLFNN